VAKRPFRPRQRRALALVRAVHPGEVRSEVTIPESSRSIDAVLPAVPASPAWGVLRGLVDRREVVLEPFSRRPDPAEVAGVLLKVAWQVERALRTGTPGGRLPLGLVLSVGRPDEALDTFRMLEPTSPAGVYLTPHPGLEVVLVDVRNLAPGPGTSFLRAFDHARDDRLAHLVTDTTLEAAIRDAILEAAMTQSDVFGSRELQRSRAELEALGERRGLERGLERGRQALLEVARSLLPPEQVAELEAIRDVDALQERVTALLKARS